MEFVYEDRYPFGRAVPSRTFAERRRLLQERLAAEGFSCVVVRGSAWRYGDLAYLTNHVPPEGSVACLHLPARGEATLYADDYRSDLVVVDRVQSLSRIPSPEGRIALLGPEVSGLLAVGLPSTAVPVGLLDEARMIKTAPEIDVLEDAAVVGAIGLEAALAMVLPGASERHVAAAGISAALRAGADGARCAVRAGPWAHLDTRWPEASDQLLESGEPVLIDLTGSYQGFRFRAGRTLGVGGVRSAGGPASSAAYTAAEAALQVLVSALRPDASVASVCQTAMDEAAHHGCTLDPHLGNGIGLDPVEPPLLRPGVSELVRSGLVLSLTVRVDSVLLVQTVAVEAAGVRLLGRFPI